MLSRIHMDPEEPMPYLSETALLSDLDEAGLEAFAAPIKPGAPVLFGELRHLGGAVGRCPPGRAWPRGWRASTWCSPRRS